MAVVHVGSSSHNSQAVHASPSQSSSEMASALVGSSSTAVHDSPTNSSSDVAVYLVTSISTAVHDNPTKSTSDLAGFHVGSSSSAAHANPSQSSSNVAGVHVRSSSTAVHASPSQSLPHKLNSHIAKKRLLAIRAKLAYVESVGGTVRAAMLNPAYGQKKWKKGTLEKEGVFISQLLMEKLQSSTVPSQVPV